MNLNWTIVGTTLLGCVSLIAPVQAGGVVVLDDKSDFVGNFTVIDFESDGQGMPLDLFSGEQRGLDPAEYAGLRIENGTGGTVGLINSQSALFDAAQLVMGSPENAIAGPGTVGLQIEFSIPVNAAGVFIMNRITQEPITIFAFDQNDELLGSAVFIGNLIDGTILGVDHGEDFDVDFGFLGLYSPNDLISTLVVMDDITLYDDLHFGIIPEPGMLLSLASLLGILGLRRFKRVNYQVLAVIIVTITFTVCARADITGTVEGKVVTDPLPICGENGWSGCSNPTLDLEPVEGVRVCIDIENGPCTYTLSDGTYTLPYSGGSNVTVEADLDGLFARAGQLGAHRCGGVVDPRAPLTEANVTPSGTADFIFNDNLN